MSKQDKEQQIAAVGGVFLILMGAGVLAAGIHAGTRDDGPTGWDLSTVAPCPSDDGPGPDGPIPCVWDALRDGDLKMGPYGPRWTLYTVDLCPSPDSFTQPAAYVACVRRSDWSGGLSGTRP